MVSIIAVSYDASSGSPIVHPTASVFVALLADCVEIFCLLSCIFRAAVSASSSILGRFFPLFVVSLRLLIIDIGCILLDRRIVFVALLSECAVSDVTCCVSSFVLCAAVSASPFELVRHHSLCDSLLRLLIIDVGCISSFHLTVFVRFALLAECVVSDEMCCASSSASRSAVSASSFESVRCLRFELLISVTVYSVWSVLLELSLVLLSLDSFVGNIVLGDANRGFTSHCHYLPFVRPSLRSVAIACICFIYCVLNPPSESAFRRSSLFVHSDRLRWDHSH